MNEIGSLYENLQILCDTFLKQLIVFPKLMKILRIHSENGEKGKDCSDKVLNSFRFGA
jgi:hypothetical protein